MADIDLVPCVKTILCGLSNATIQVVKGLIQTQLAIVTGQISTVEAQLATLNVAANATQAAANLIIAEINSIRSQANVVPLAIIAGCTPLGDLNRALNQNIDLLIANFEVFIGNLTRQLSFIDELNLLLEDLHEVEDLFNSILLTISTCGATT